MDNVVHEYYDDDSKCKFGIDIFDKSISVRNSRLTYSDDPKPQIIHSLTDKCNLCDHVKICRKIHQYNVIILQFEPKTDKSKDVKEEEVNREKPKLEKHKKVEDKKEDDKKVDDKKVDDKKVEEFERK